MPNRNFACYDSLRSDSGTRRLENCAPGHTCNRGTAVEEPHQIFDREIPFARSIKDLHADLAIHAVTIQLLRAPGRNALKHTFGRLVRSIRNVQLLPCQESDCAHTKDKWGAYIKHVVGHFSKLKFCKSFRPVALCTRQDHQAGAFPKRVSCDANSTERVRRVCKSVVRRKQIRDAAVLPLSVHREAGRAEMSAYARRRARGALINHLELLAHPYNFAKNAVEIFLVYLFTSESRL